MFVELGNNKAIEGYREPGEEEVKYRSLDGEQITTLQFPEGLSLNEAFTATVETMRYHIEQGESPSWVHSDSKGLEALLKEHFDIQDSAKPKEWGVFKANETPGVVAAKSAAAARKSAADKGDEPK